MWWVIAACRPIVPSILPPLEPFDGRFTFPGANVAYYEVEGRDVDSLRISLAKDAPGDEDLRQRGATSWDIHWDYDWNSDRDCDLSRPRVHVSVKVELPHWAGEPDADRSLRLEWRRYVGALADHERGHVERILARSADVAPAIRRATCATADLAGKRVLDQLRRENDDYDLLTDSGRGQGASFGPPHR